MGSITMSTTGRVVIAVALTVAFYVVALGLAALLGVFVWAEMTHVKHANGRGVLSACIAIAVILWSVAPRIDRFPDPGVRLQRDRQLALWQLIEAVAQATRQAMPAEVFLVGDVNAFVAQRGGIAGIGSRRVLGIGLPLLQLLTVAQVRAVLAHEFGHFHGGDTKLGPWIYKTRGAIVRTVNNFARVGSWLHLPFRWYAKLFLRVTQAVSRRQELAADALSVAVAGPAAAKGALQAISSGAPMFDFYLRHEYLGALDGGVRPPLLDGFRRFLGSPKMQELRAGFAERALAEKVDPYDTHPPLAERLAAVDALAQSPGAAHGAAARAAAGGDASAATLLTGLPEAELELLRFQVRGSDLGKLPAVGWDAVADITLPKHWREVAFEHAGKLPALTVAEFAAQRERVPQLAAALRQPGKDTERLAHARHVLCALLAFRLHAAGFAVNSPPGYPVVLFRGERALQPFDLLDPVDQGGISDDAWRALCTEERIGELPLAGPAARPPSAK
jgi:Zn-dependent protease with chaperone function